jgi:hypothetical protein
LIVFNQQHLTTYQEDDVTLRRMRQSQGEGDGLFTTHRWLLDSLPKRMIFQAVYGDLLEAAGPSRTILDVGGGYSSLTRPLLARHQYKLLDLMAHDDHAALGSLQQSLGHDFWINSDWYSFQSSVAWDLVIANDLFPNVDQRLAPFLEKYLPLCREIRISLTYYNIPRWYQVKRIDADEVFHMMAWDGEQLRRTLSPFAGRIASPQWDLLQQNPPSLFANGRQVAYLSLQGNQGVR